MLNTPDIAMQKAELRTRMRHFLSSLNVKQRTEKSRAIFSKLREEPLFKNAGSVFCYAALPSEADTAAILDDILGLGKSLYMPRMNTSGSLDCCKIENLKEDLTPGRYGVLEPGESSPVMTDFTKLDVALIPGLAFDRRGHRLGRGMGYFDRFLAGLKGNCFLTGLCFHEQLFDAIPYDQHDIAMNSIITDAGNHG